MHRFTLTTLTLALSLPALATAATGPMSTDRIIIKYKTTANVQATSATRMMNVMGVAQQRGLQLAKNRRWRTGGQAGAVGVAYGSSGVGLRHSPQ